MSIRLSCPNCEAVATVEEQSLGRRGRCKKCGHVFALARPGGEAASAISGDASAWKRGSEPASPTNLPEQFGRYRIMKQLGQGGMGAVYLAFDTKLEREVALKVPFFTPADGPQAVQRFEREARAAATLDHPNLCPIHDVGEVDGIHYLTMPYIKGKSLSEAIGSGQTVTEGQAAAVALKIAQALKEAHDHGIIHRDLKPGNIMVNRRRELIVMDFGLARVVDADDRPITRTGHVLGTALYMAPEQAAGDLAAIGPTADVYSLGVMLYELLTGRRPFEGPWSVVIGLKSVKDPDPPSTHRPDLSPTLNAICLKAIAREPKDRYPTMAEFAEALTSFATSSGPIPISSGSSHPAETLESLAAPAFAAIITQEVASLQEEKFPAQPKSARGEDRARLSGRGKIIAAASVAAVLFLGLIIESLKVGFEPKTKGAVQSPKDAVLTTSKEAGNPAVLSTDKPTVPAGNPGIAATDKPDAEKVPGTLEISGPKSTTETLVRSQDVFQKDSVWTGTGVRMRDGKKIGIHDFVRLTILGRDGNQFRARYVVDKQERIVTGTVQNGTISWSIANVQVIKGSAGHDHVGKVHDNELILHYGTDGSSASGMMNLTLTLAVITPMEPTAVSAETQEKVPDPLTRQDPENPPVAKKEASQTKADRKNAERPDGWVSLFNGRDLTGWKKHERQPGNNWGVVNGILVGRGPSISHLYTERDDFTDYHLRIVARFSKGGGSGVFIRCPFGPRLPAEDPKWPEGYEATINNARVVRNSTGELYPGVGNAVFVSETNQATKVPFDQWFTLDVIAEGNVFTTLTNGKSSGYRIVAQKNLISSGHIALQQSTPETVIEFGKIEIKELNRSDRKDLKEIGKDKGHKDRVSSVVFSSDGTEILSGENVGESKHFNTGGSTFHFDHAYNLRSWKPAGGGNPRTLPGVVGAGTAALGFSSDGRYAASSAHNLWEVPLLIWDLSSGKSIHQLSWKNTTNKPGRCTSLSFAPDDRHLMAASSNGTVLVWDLATEEEQTPITLKAGPIKGEEFPCATFSSDRKNLVTGSRIGTIDVWELRDGKKLQTFVGHMGEVRNVACSADGRLILSLGTDNTVRSWNAATGRGLKQLRGEERQVLCIAVSPDGQRALTAGVDGPVRLWDLASGRELCRMDGHTMPVNSVAFSSDGLKAVSGSDDRSVRLWQLPE